MMILRENKDQVSISMRIDMSLDDLARKIPASQNSGKLLQMAEDSFYKVHGIWRPRAIFRWLSVAEVSESRVSLALPDKTNVYLTMGFSSQFLQPASRVMIAVYTVGDELKNEAMKASSERRHLDAYVYDIISLAILEKTGRYINNIVEKEAAKKNWKVGPFLSPGSVHGWEMTDQSILCSLLSLNEIDVQCGDDGVLKPFDTLSCLIGIGPGYASETVGSTCRVCANSHRCEMKKTMENK